MNESELGVHNERRAALRRRMALAHVEQLELATMIGCTREHLSRMLNDDGEAHPVSLLTFQRALRAIADLSRSRCSAHDEENESNTEE